MNFQKKIPFIFLTLFFLTANLFAIDINLAEKEKVQVLKQKYLTTHRQWLYNILDKATPYRIYVRSEIEKRGLPSFLEYLPIVESDYNPKAVSPSNACGMWQFMLNSIAPNLRYNDYIDERFDPWKSTNAALIKLQENYYTFGDWLLAITAYNCGAGAMARAIKKGQSRDFWYLSENGFLSDQACLYVPKLLAIAEVCDNQKKYDITFPTAKDEFGEKFYCNANDFDYIRVKDEVNIMALAKYMRIDETEFLRLNLALTKQLTPPDQEYDIRLPSGTKECARWALQSMGYLPLD